MPKPSSQMAASANNREEFISRGRVCVRGERRHGIRRRAQRPQDSQGRPDLQNGALAPKSGRLLSRGEQADGQRNQRHSRTPAFEIARHVGRSGAAPRGREISWPQCVLGRPCRRDWNGPHVSNRSSLVRSELVAEKLIENLSTHLRALAERDSGLRSGNARFRLPPGRRTGPRSAG